ncbi:mucin-17-like [Engraulis encrasicolus]|uniref:mucin-17-like n=1 Tax=Engraulis encrasicolus TaxID=184585 RepID=UPI002FD69BC2
MSSHNSSTGKYHVPDGLRPMLEGFTKAVVNSKPQNVRHFGEKYFKALGTFRDENPGLSFEEVLKEFKRARPALFKKKAHPPSPVQCKAQKSWEAGLLLFEASVNQDAPVPLFPAGDSAAKDSEAPDGQVFPSEGGEALTDNGDLDGVISANIVTLSPGPITQELAVDLAVFRRKTTPKSSPQHSSNTSQNGECSDTDAPCQRICSALFEQVPLDVIDMDVDAVLIRTATLPNVSQIIVQSEDVPEVIVFHADIKMSDSRLDTECAAGMDATAKTGESSVMPPTIHAHCCPDNSEPIMARTADSVEMMMCRCAMESPKVQAIAKTEVDSASQKSLMSLSHHMEQSNMAERLISNQEQQVSEINVSTSQENVVQNTSCQSYAGDSQITKEDTASTNSPASQTCLLSSVISATEVNILPECPAMEVTMASISATPEPARMVGSQDSLISGSIPDFPSSDECEPAIGVGETSRYDSPATGKTSSSALPTEKTSHTTLSVGKTSSTALVMENTSATEKTSTTDLPFEKTSTTALPIEKTSCIDLAVEKISSTTLVSENISSTVLPVEKTSDTALPLEKVSTTTLPIEKASYTTLPIEKVSTTALPIQKISTTVLPIEKSSSTALSIEKSSTAFPIESINTAALPTETSCIEKTSTTALSIEKVSTASLPVEKTSSTTIVVERTSSTALPTEKTSYTALPIEKVSTTVLPVEKTSSSSLAVERTSNTALHIEKTSCTALPIENTSAAALPIEQISTNDFPVEKTSCTTLAVERTSSTALAAERTSSTALAVERTSSTALAAERTSSTALAAERTSSTALAVERTSSTALAAERTSSTALPIEKTSCTTLPIDDDTSATTLSVEKVSTTVLPLEKTSSTTLAVERTSSTALAVERTSSTALAVERTSSTALAVERTSSTALPIVKTSCTAFPVERTSSTALPIENISATALPIEKVSTTVLPVEKTSSTSLAVERTSNTALTAERTSNTALTAERTSNTALTAERTSSTALAVDRTSSTALAVERTSSTALAIEKTSYTALPVERTSCTALPVEKTSSSTLSVQRTGGSTSLPTGKTTDLPVISKTSSSNFPVMGKKSSTTSPVCKASSGYLVSCPVAAQEEAKVPMSARIPDAVDTQLPEEEEIKITNIYSASSMCTNSAPPVEVRVPYLMYLPLPQTVTQTNADGKEVTASPYVCIPVASGDLSRTPSLGPATAPQVSASSCFPGAYVPFIDVQTPSSTVPLTQTSQDQMQTSRPWQPFAQHQQTTPLAGEGTGPAAHSSAYLQQQAPPASAPINIGHQPNLAHYGCAKPAPTLCPCVSPANHWRLCHLTHPTVQVAAPLSCTYQSSPAMSQCGLPQIAKIPMYQDCGLYCGGLGHTLHVKPSCGNAHAHHDRAEATSCSGHNLAPGGTPCSSFPSEHVFAHQVCAHHVQSSANQHCQAMFATQQQHHGSHHMCDMGKERPGSRCGGAYGSICNLSKPAAPSSCCLHQGSTTRICHGHN